MIGLFFLVCMSSGECSTHASGSVFTTVVECELMAEEIMYRNALEVKAGRAPEHTAHFICYQFGEPA